MEDKQRPEYLFVINRGSGRDDITARDKRICDFLAEKNITGGIYYLPDHFSLKQIQDHVLSVNPKKLVAVGGDGTVNILAGIVAGKNITLGIIPGGSANGMAKELSIPVNIDEALEVIDTGTEKNIDLILINRKNYCIHISDIGLNARLIKYFDEGKLRGKLGYSLVILKTLWQQKKMQVAIRTETENIFREAFMVALANARTYGTGAVINPEGNPGDGIFEVIIIRRLSFASLLKMLFRPGIFNPKKIEIIPCTSVEITTGKPMHFQADGEYLGKVLKVEGEIAKGAVRMILPAENK